MVDAIKTKKKADAHSGEAAQNEIKTIKQSEYSAAHSRRAAVAAQKERAKADIKTVEITGKKEIKTGHRIGNEASHTVRSNRIAIKARKVRKAKKERDAIRASIRSSKMAAKASETAAKTVARSAKALGQVIIAGAKAAVSATKALIAALASGGSVAVIIIFIVVLFGGALCMIGGSNGTAAQPVSAEVEAYTPLIRHYAEEYGIPEYVDLIKAVMMQESGGNGGDPMQCSACGYNTVYPNGITDPEYSIDVGTHYLADCLHAANVQNPMDLERIKLALQGYNFGAGYISWAIENYGGYSFANAQAFAEAHGCGYGDVSYVTNVLRYYPFGRIPTGGGNSTIVQVAASQVGNVGGEPYWSWYGFGGRVEWCACFVSWCAEQCGYIASGAIPKFSYVPDGVSFFQSNGRLQDGSYTPSPGDIIFFTWDGGGPEHVGIVESVSDGNVNTIEGNTTDSCARRSYPIGSSVIYAYGVPAY